MIENKFFLRRSFFSELMPVYTPFSSRFASLGALLSFSISVEMFQNITLTCMVTFTKGPRLLEGKASTSLSGSLIVKLLVLLPFYYLKYDLINCFVLIDFTESLFVK